MRRLLLRQPSWRERRYELVEGDEVRGTLSMSTLRGTATAEADGRTWELRRSGLLKPRVVALRAGLEEATARWGGLRGNGTIDVGGHTHEWRRDRGIRSRYLVLADGQELIRLAVRPRREHRLDVEAGEGAGALLLLLSAFLALLREDENAVAAAT